MAKFDSAGPEPGLEEMLADPIVHSLMRRDGVDRLDVEAVVKQVRRHLAKRGAAPGRGHHAAPCRDVPPPG